MKCVIVLSVLLIAVQGTGQKNHVNNIQKMFLATMNHYYGEEGAQKLLKRDVREVKDRVINFERAVEIVEDNNDNHDTLYVSQLNHISVLTESEKKAMLNADPNSFGNHSHQIEVVAVKRQGVPDSVNWVARKAQPAVKDQGSCGSCWAYGAVSALEGNYYILTGDLIAFSEQEYLDCAFDDYYEKTQESWAATHSGCDGGWIDTAYNYTMTVQRMANMADFPYQGKDRGCSSLGDTANSFTKATLTGIDMTMRGDDEKLKGAVAQGIVGVGIRIAPDLYYYRTGIFSCTGECDCSLEANHAATVVGYTDAYWTVRNSWGVHWGEGGYVKMSRAQSNICNINRYAMAPILACREGKTCKGWEEDFVADEEEEAEEEDADFDSGDYVKCGEIKHFGNLCVSLDDTPYMNAVLSATGCSEEFCLTSKGYIKDSATGKCLTSSNPGQNNNLVAFGACQSAETWTETDRGLKIKESGKCWQPDGGSSNPLEDSKVVINDECDADKNEFKIVPNMCWEEYANAKLSKKIKVDGKLQKSNNFKNAQEMCEQNDKCKGLRYKRKAYQLCASDKVRKGSTSSKAIVMKPCRESCDAGLDRCEDGECRESCTDGEDNCPAGTLRCEDGNCKHVHMCSGHAEV